MSLQYLSDETGHVVAVQLPIEEWEQLKSKYPDLEAPAYVIPGWHKEKITALLHELPRGIRRELGSIPELAIASSATISASRSDSSGELSRSI